MYEGTQLPLLAALLTAIELLAWVCLILIWVVEPFECRVGVLAVVRTPSPRLLVIVFALVRQVKVLVRRPPVVEGLVRVDAVVPVVVLRFVGAVGCLVAVDVEDNGVYRFQVELEPLLEGHVLQLAVEAHLLEVGGHSVKVFL